LKLKYHQSLSNFAFNFNLRRFSVVGVISEPEVNTRELDGGDRLLVLASDGVWEHLSDQEAIDIAASAGGYAAGAGGATTTAAAAAAAAAVAFDNAAAARAVCAAARVRWTTGSAAGVDDITAVVAHLDQSLRGSAPARLRGGRLSTSRGGRLSIARMLGEIDIGGEL
jgi:pyruvate dehydrogenase phosphatase